MSREFGPILQIGKDTVYKFKTKKDFQGFLIEIGFALIEYLDEYLENRIRKEGDFE